MQLALDVLARGLVAVRAGGVVGKDVAEVLRVLGDGGAVDLTVVDEADGVFHVPFPFRNGSGWACI